MKPTAKFASRKHQPLTAHGRKVTGEGLAPRYTARSPRGAQCVKESGKHPKHANHRTQSGTTWYA